MTSLELLFASAFIAITVVAIAMTIHNINKLNSKESEDNPEVNSYVELCGNQFMMYEEGTHLFLGSGKTMEELSKSLELRFPEHKFIYRELKDGSKT